MSFRVLVSISLLAAVFSAPRTPYVTYEAAKPCNASACKLPDCRCLSTDIPGGLSAKDIPQLVLLTFDDAITAQNILYYRRAFFDRKNPDGCPVSTTYYMSHEYTDYSAVHELHSHGQEIALHSITHETNTAYWDNLSVEGQKEEFGELVDIISHFANIPGDYIKGIRVPFLQLGGNNSFQAIKELGLVYDASWPTQDFMNPPLWPYSLDYKSEQDCSVGTCPKASLPGVWVQPMVDWTDDSGYICAMVDACTYIPSDVEGILAFMIRNFKRHYESNRAPFGFYVHSAWFAVSERFEAYLKFLDYLQSFDDVYLVGTSKAIEWTRRPTPIAQLKELWPECQRTYAQKCTRINCELRKGQEYRYMRQCLSTCPATYPWLGNPLGRR